MAIDEYGEGNPKLYKKIEDLISRMAAGIPDTPPGAWRYIGHSNGKLITKIVTAEEMAFPPIRATIEQKWIMD